MAKICVKLTDEMYSDASMHDENGDWQMIFGLNTLPEYQRKGYATKIMNAMIDLARQEKRKGLVLTCKDRLVPYYSKFGFKNEGVSSSVHGAVWRCKKDGRKNRRFDEFWTRGDWDDFYGYRICGIQTYRIIAKAFWGIDDRFAIINFKDDDKRNLSVDNLYIKEKDAQDIGYNSIEEAFGCDLKPSDPLSLDENL